MELKTKISLIVAVSFGLFIIVQSYPRKRLVSGVIPSENRRSSRLTSVLSDYWAERGFHDALTDHLLASESQSKDLMMTGDEIQDFIGIPKIRIPRQRLTPPLRSSKSRKRVHRPRVKLTPAQRKQDMEIMESVTLVDGGTQLPDGRIQIRPSTTTYQRKYHNGGQLNDEMSPLAYYLQDDLPISKPQQKQPQLQQLQQPRQNRQQGVSSSYFTLPFAYQEQERPISIQQQQQRQQLKQQQIFQQQQSQQFRQQHLPQGKPATAYKAPKSIHQLSIDQFQKQQLHLTEQPQQHSLYSLYNSVQASADTPISPHQPPQQAKKPNLSIFVLPSPTTTPKPTLLKPAQPQAAPEVVHVYPQVQKPQPTQQKPQIFQQQYNHPFGSQNAEPGPLAKFTAALLQTAGAAAGAASAAATALSQSELVSAYRQHSPNIPLIPTTPFSISQSVAAADNLPVSVPIPEGGTQSLSQSYITSMISAADSTQQLSHVLLPTTTMSAYPKSTLPPGVVAEEQALLDNQLLEPESLAKKITRIYETGKKILYFPKGVVDTVDTFLKQMERNPTVAYWGDKFFAKVFGDTSGTKK